MSCAKTAELIEMPFVFWTGVGQGSMVRWGAHWRHLVNTTEPSMCCGLLSNYFDNLLCCSFACCEHSHRHLLCPVKTRKMMIGMTNVPFVFAVLRTTNLYGMYLIYLPHIYTFNLVQ